MANFLFWNICKKDLTEQIVNLCHEKNIDVLILAESESVDSNLSQALSKGKRRKYYSIDTKFEKISFYHRYPKDMVKPLYATPAIINIPVPNIVLSPPIGEDILIVSLHVPSKLLTSDDRQMSYVKEVMNEVRLYEAERGNERTIIVGDLNMNPFEKGIASFDCFHSVMDKKIAERGYRKLYGSPCSFFYNPMWRLMGNSFRGPLGTYYYRSSETIEYFWHTFDQVLLRPPLIPYFKEDTLQIIDSVGEESLLNKNGRPDKKIYSDHLPIYFEIQIENMEESTNGEKESVGNCGRRPKLQIAK